MPLWEILSKVASWAPGYVTVTGGEPLAQESCISLLAKLCDQGYEVSLETSGALDVSRVDERVVKVMDLKTPNSGELDRNLYSNIEHLNQHDQVKFVICSREDYLWSRQKLDQYRLGDRVSDVLFSPSHNQLNPAELAEWILEDCLPVRLQLQLHKYLWADEQGR